MSVLTHFYSFEMSNIAFYKTDRFYQNCGEILIE